MIDFCIITTIVLLLNLLITTNPFITINLLIILIAICMYIVANRRRNRPYYINILFNCLILYIIQPFCITQVI